MRMHAQIKNINEVTAIDEVSSAAVERSFSILNKLLRKDRNFDVKNVKKYMMLFYNKILDNYAVWLSLKTS